MSQSYTFFRVNFPQYGDPVQGQVNTKVNMSCIQTSTQQVVMDQFALFFPQAQ